MHSMYVQKTKNEGWTGWHEAAHVWMMKLLCGIKYKGASSLSRLLSSNISATQENVAQQSLVEKRNLS